MKYWETRRKRKDVHCARSNESLAQVTGSPRVRSHGDGVSCKGVGLHHVAGDGAEHGADLGCRRHCECVVVVWSTVKVGFCIECRCLINRIELCSRDLFIRKGDWSVD
jgi:hypothetical protein